ncbi:MAG: hypothetical protein H7Y60_03975 [Rhodospirillaceae bacterium]|nr:hypothetical protein [Rhodospirillales bacterium]
MDLPADQRLLYRDLTAKLDAQADEAQLIRFMGGVLHSLLRRKGDAEFLKAVQDSFTTGLTGRSWHDQITLAREVIGLVVTKRPEVAVAWQTLNHQEPRPYQRRAADQGDASVASDLDDLPDFSLAPDETDEVVPGARPEELVADYVASVLERRLALFPAPVLRLPSPVYSHEQPFFLFSPQFFDLAQRFVSRVLLGLMRPDLDRVLYHHMDAALLADEDKLKAFLAERRPDLWAVVLARLGRLAGDLRSVQSKLAAGHAGDDDSEFQMVEVPVTQPRVFRVLGVAFTMGSRTDVKYMKVRVNPSSKPDNDEMLALDVITQLRDMAARVGLELPETCDFAFLRTLLDFDAARYANDLAEMQALAANKDTPRETLLARLNKLDEVYPAEMTDALALTLFYNGSDGAFGFAELYDLGLEWSRTAHRPFLLAEIARRPRDLAFQIRDCLRNRVDRNGMGLSVVMLFEVWRVMDRARFKAEMDAALTVFSAFPVAFAGDRDEKVFTEIGAVLFKTLSTEPLEAANTIETVIRLYTPVAERAKR